MTPEQLRRKCLDWEPIERPLCFPYEVGDEMVYTPLADHKVIVRDDTMDALGVVGSGYSVFGNDALTRLVESIVGGPDIPCIDTGGSLRGGRRVWFLIKLDTLNIAGVDPVDTYALIAAGHDGLFKIRGLITVIRVVCHNTFTMAGAYDESLGITIKHSKHMNVDPEAFRGMIAGAKSEAHEMGDKFEALANVEMTSAQLNSFFTQVYAKANGAPTPIRDGQSESQRKRADRSQRKATKVLSEWISNFEDHDDGNAAPAIRGTAWEAFNSVTRWSDHARTVRGENDSPGNRIDSNLFGSSQEFKSMAFKEAMTLV